MRSRTVLVALPVRFGYTWLYCFGDEHLVDADENEQVSMDCSSSSSPVALKDGEDLEKGIYSRVNISDACASGNM